MVKTSLSSRPAAALAGLFYGPMASGKTSTLLRCAKQLSPSFGRIVGIKSNIDSRWGAEHIRSRCGLLLQATPLSVLRCAKISADTLFVVDEAQFFPDLLEFYSRVFQTSLPGVGLLAAGLHEDSGGHDFGQVNAVASLLQSAQVASTASPVRVFVEKLSSICSHPGCGLPAEHTHRQSQSAEDEQQVKVGDLGEYLPLCGRHFQRSAL